MNPEFYPNGQAVFIERSNRTLIIADPHFGVEIDLRRRGLHFQSGTVRPNFDLFPATMMLILKHLLKDELLPINDAVIDWVRLYTLSHHSHAQTCRKTHYLHHHPVVDINDKIGCSLRGTPSYLLAEIDGFAVNFPEKTSTTRVFFRPCLL
jgi:metallophosphoesterase superfamily enzyme